MPPRLHRLSVLVPLFLLLASTAPAAGDVDLSAREWNQPRANPMRTSAVDVEPLTAPPGIAWRRKEGELSSNLVTWSGAVFGVFKAGSKRELRAIHAATGEVLAKKRISKGGTARLAAWQGMVFVVDSGGIEAFTHKGKRFGSGWKKKGGDFSAPLVHDDRLVLSDGDELVVFDTRKGGELVRAEGACGMLSLQPSGSSPLLVGPTVVIDEYEETRHGGLIIFKAANFGGKEPELAVQKRLPFFELSDGTARDWADGVVALGLGGTRRHTRRAWMLTRPKAFEKDTWGYVLPEGYTKPTGTTTICRPAALSDGVIYGFTAMGELMGVSSEGDSWSLIEKAQFPKGARAGSASVARGVLFLGNWAVELETSRVLWRLPEIDPATPAIPAGDGLLVLATKEGELIGLSAASSAEPTAGETSTPADVTRELPADADGVLLADGRFVRGTASRKGEGFRVTPAEGEPFDAAPGEVLLVSKGGRPELHGEEFEVFYAWRDILEACHLDALEELYASAVRTGLLDAARRFLVEAKEHGLDAGRSEEWSRKMTGRRETGSGQLAKSFAKKEAEVRASSAEKFLTGMAWCSKRGLGDAAAVLLAIATRVQPGREDVEKLARPLVPAGFPWAHLPNAGRRWLVWAEKMLPAGAAFLPTDDPAWERVGEAPWDEDVLGFRTRNLVLFTRSEDAEVVTACLRNGEGTVRALVDLLSEGRSLTPASDDDRLEVRLHRSRDEFHAEAGEHMLDAAGYYSPDENVSRFYVPRADEASQGVERDLYSVLAHELTHHYVSARWMGDDADRNVLCPGFWIVEGIARFLENQAVEMGRRGLRFDDVTVSSIDASCQLAKQGKLIPIRRLFGLSQMAFHQLSEEIVAEVTLRNTLATYRMNEVLVFYDQAGSLVYLMLHRSGPEGRAGLVRYMRDHYQGKTKADGWKTLGFATADELEKKFVAFLKGLE